MEAKVWAVITMVAARPAAGVVPNRSAAAVDSAGYSKALDTPVARQNTASAASPEKVPTMAARPISPSAAAATVPGAMRPISGASATPASTAPMPASPRRVPVSA